MAVLSWGKPKVEFALLGENDTPGEWKEFPEIVENTAQLTTTEGNLIEANQEGGERVDARRSASAYSFALSVFAKKGDTKPIEDTNGIIPGNYAVRLTGEDAETVGFLMAKASVSGGDSWTSEQGTYWNYTFEGLKPTSGKIVEPYSEEDTPEEEDTSEGGDTPQG